MERSTTKGLSRDLQRHLGRCVEAAAEPVVKQDLTAHMVTLLDMLDRAEIGGRKRFALR